MGLVFQLRLLPENDLSATRNAANPSAIANGNGTRVRPGLIQWLAIAEITEGEQLSAYELRRILSACLLPVRGGLNRGQPAVTQKLRSTIVTRERVPGLEADY